MLAGGATLAAASLALAHDTWLRSDTGTVAPGTRVTYHLTSGEGFAADDLAVDAKRVVDRGVWLGGRRLSLDPVAGGPAPGKPGALLLRATLSAPGVAIAWVRLAPRRLTLDSAKQVEYLDDIHAPESVLAPWRAKPAPRAWREEYTKHAKAVTRVRAVGDTSDVRDTTWAVPVGLGLEIVPERNPTRLYEGDRLTVRVLRRGAPLAGLPLGAERDGGTPSEWQTTDASGRATFTLAKPGRWLLHGTDLRASRRAGLDWESDFTTLTIAVLPR